MKLGFPDNVRIDAVIDKPLFVADEIPELIFTLSSDKPIDNFTWHIAEGATIPVRVITVEEEE
jgi:hypothetical protein